MSNNDAMAMARAMSGQLHEIINKRTGIDVRGVKDPMPLWEIDRLIRFAYKRKRKHAIKILLRARKKVILSQHTQIIGSLREDISHLGLYSGNDKKSFTEDDIVGNGR
jgi:hypothetical protein